MALALALSAAGCGGSSNGDVTLTIGARSFPEQVVLGQIYGQALEGAGYKVKKELDLGYETIWPPEELKEHRISGYPEHLNTALGSLEVAVEDQPADPHEAYEEAKSRLAKKGLTAFPPTPFGLVKAVGLLKKTADDRGLKKISDLQGQSKEMTIRGPPYCHIQLDCVGGIEAHYGFGFKAYDNVAVARRYKVLEDGEVDASIVYSTDGSLAPGNGKFVSLEDDKHAFPAGNVVFVTSQKVAEEAGPDFEATIVAAQKGLTPPVMQKLDAAVEIEKRDPAKVAAEYLKMAGVTE